MVITLDEVVEILKTKDDFLIIAHRSPDGDTLGSAFGLHHILNEIDKRSKVVCSDPFPEGFSFLTKSYKDVDLEEKYIITVDIADIPLLGEKYIPYKDKIDLSIDHHISNSLFAKKTYLEPLAANCENIYNIGKKLNIKFNKTIADCLYTGISTDTGCFRFSNTSSNTHRTAANLIDYGADCTLINRLMFETKTKARLEVEKHVYNSLETYFNGKVALIHVPLSVIEKSNASEDEIEGISSIPRQLEGVEIGVTLRETPRGIRVSFRTHEGYDASEIASHFGGGGHNRAAGAFIKKSFEDARKDILSVIEGIL